MSLPVVIFTFSCDHLCTVEAARAAIAAGLGPVFVKNDATDPIPDESARTLRSMGCRVTDTTFPRNGNLKGRKTLAGMIGCYREVFAATGARHLAKLDSDTEIVRSRKLLEAAADGVSFASMSHGRTPFFGMCFVISSPLADAVAALLESGDPVEGFMDHNFPEDLVTGTLSRRFALGETRQWPFNPAGGFGAGYLYVQSKVPLEEYADRFDVVTFGNRHLIPGGGKPCAKRAQVAETMLEFSEILSRKRHGQP